MSVLAARLSESYDAHVAAARRLPALVADLPFTVLPCSSVCLCAAWRRSAMCTIGRRRMLLEDRTAGIDGLPNARLILTATP